MYWKFYGLREDPFGLTPDGRYLFLPEAHQEVLATLEESIEGQRGFVALTSLPGLGKTTLLFHLLDHLQATAVTAFVFQTTFEPTDILRLLWKELGLDNSQPDVVKLHQQFEEGLARVAAMGKQFVLVVDEAQNLSPAAFETIRLLANFESCRKKMVQIVVSGHPELESLLARPGLEHIKQRIAAHCRLKPFTAEETRQYVNHRLQVAGHSGAPIFTEGALEALSELSKGIPRTINIYAFQAMSKASRKQVRTIDEHALRVAVHQFEGWPEPEQQTHTDLLIAPREMRAVVPPPMPAPAPSPAIDANLELRRLLERMQPELERAGLAASALEQKVEASPRLEIPPHVAKPAPIEVVPVASMGATAAALKREDSDKIAVMPAKGPVAVAATAKPARAKVGKKLSLTAMHIAAGIAIVAALAVSAWYAIARGWIALPSGWTEAPPQIQAAAQRSETAAASTGATPATTAATNQVAQSTVPAQPRRAANGTPDATTKPSAPQSSAAKAPAEIEAGSTRRWGVEDAPAPAAALTSLAVAANPLGSALTGVPETRVSQVKPVVFTAPQVNVKPLPPYPAMAKQQRLAGIVELKVSVDAQGRPTNVQVVSGHPVLAAVAVNTVKRQWRFTPATADGKPVAGETTVRLNFRPH